MEDDGEESWREVEVNLNLGRNSVLSIPTLMTYEDLAILQKPPMVNGYTTRWLISVFIPFSKYLADFEKVFSDILFLCKRSTGIFQNLSPKWDLTAKFHALKCAKNPSTARVSALRR